MRYTFLLLALLLTGCNGAGNTFVGFTCRAKAYSAQPATLERNKPSSFLLAAGSGSTPVQFHLPVKTGPGRLKGKTFSVQRGLIRLPVATLAKLAVASGQITVQSIEGHIATGNYDLVCSPPDGGKPLKIVGSFDASLRR